MATALTVLLWLLVAVLALALAALLSPVDFDVSLHTERDARFKIVARPFFGIGPAIRLNRTKTDGAKTERAPKRRKKKRKSRSFRRLPKAFNFPAAVDFLGQILQSVKLRELSLKADIGLDDPADTGLLYGAFAPMMYGMYGLERCSVDVRPVFDAPCHKIELDGSVRLVPLRIVGALVQFGWRLFGPFK